MSFIKIVNNKLNWTCLAEKCPDNCCEKYCSKLNTFLKHNDNMIPLTYADKKGLIALKNNKIKIKKFNRQEYLVTLRNGKCPFLFKSKCTIYKNRGSSCKSYPFIIDKYNGLCGNPDCPGWGKGWTDMSEVRSMLKNLLKIYSLHTKNIKKNFDL